tara:strand:- start:743 stop:1237 length:495 start_codon:yes stop_codon:yes gene_type:complete
MPGGVYERKPKSLATLQKTRTSDFFKSEKGKVWFEYEGCCSKNKKYVYETNQFYYKRKMLELNPDYKPRGPRGYKLPFELRLDKRTSEEKYRDRIAKQQEKILCSCGEFVRRGYMSVHSSTQKHYKKEQEMLDHLPPPPQEWLDEIEMMDKPKKGKLIIIKKCN